MKVCDPHTFLSSVCQKKACQIKSELRILTETCRNQKFPNFTYTVAKIQALNEMQKSQ